MELLLSNNLRVTLTSKGVIFPEGCSEDAWRETLSLLKSVRDGYHMALADTIAYGRERFGDEKVAEAMVQLEFSQADFNMASNISRIPIGLRKNDDGLTAEHFHVVGHIFGDNEPAQKKWLATAAKEHLSPRELRRSIDTGSVVRSDPQRTGRSSGGIVTIQGIMFTFDQWRRQVGGQESMLHWEEKERRQWLEETRPFAELRKAVEESLTTGPEY
jgi:hypothetical protein